ncbi:MAG: hypothetical protein QME47_04875 [Candidatus Thermoplasmatota archaeon]|nr:hypothetical protein [Candidatus Thermoplasmatota archaeon]
MDEEQTSELTNLEKEWCEYLKRAFGALAPTILKLQKEKIGLLGNLSFGDYQKLAEQIYTICIEMVGENYAQKIRTELLSILKKWEGKK